MIYLIKSRLGNKLASALIMVTSTNHGARVWSYLNDFVINIFIFHERLPKVYHEYFSVVYTMKLLGNTHFMKCSERNISQCILAFRNQVTKNLTLKKSHGKNLQLISV